MMFKDVPLRTRRALSLQSLWRQCPSRSQLTLNSINALLALNGRYDKRIILNLRPCHETQYEVLSRCSYELQFMILGVCFHYVNGHAPETDGYMRDSFALGNNVTITFTRTVNVIVCQGFDIWISLTSGLIMKQTSFNIQIRSHQVRI